MNIAVTLALRFETEHETTDEDREREHKFTRKDLDSQFWQTRNEFWENLPFDIEEAGVWIRQDPNGTWKATLPPHNSEAPEVCQRDKHLLQALERLYVASIFGAKIKIPF
ncbi:hypothetical protein [Paludibacterium purpuratum]|uniref:hypothetical protein n=1 Tax=Paludibacterium purpuratum TaxID=1144873 RepID=UPI00105FDD3C|nr:hypothetical protein [Paludibacterium purpuratum]